MKNWYCYDDDAGDFLDNIEMKNVLAAAKKAAGHKINILGMDACLMSMAEVACQVHSSVSYTVGSEQTEPLDGWPYHTLLAELAKNPTMPTKDFSAVIVNKYIASYPPSEAVTQSACDLAKSNALTKAIKELAAVLSAELDNSVVRLALMQARAQVQSYEVQENIDLVDFCKLLTDNSALDNVLKATGRKVIDAVAAMVVQSGCKGASVKNSYGVAIYFPTISISPLYAKLDFTKKTGWGAFLNKYLTVSRRR